MNKFFHSVYLDSDKCTGCITCLKRCPTQAIRVRDGKAHIINEFCIDCGECIRHCPHHAKHTKRDFIPVLKDYKYTVALPAPSLYSQFNNVKNTNIILTALVLAGFDDVFEVSAGAEIISELSRKYISEHPELYPLISTACPTVEPQPKPVWIHPTLASFFCLPALPKSHLSMIHWACAKVMSMRY